jgi:hypothetical protein
VPQTARFTVMAMIAALGVILAATVIGLVANWPRDRTIDPPRSLVRPKTERAEVVALAAERCRVPGRSGCRRVTVELESGKDKGERASFTVGDATSDVRLDVGETIRV